MFTRQKNFPRTLETALATSALLQGKYGPRTWISKSKALGLTRGAKSHIPEHFQLRNLSFLMILSQLARAGQSQVKWKSTPAKPWRTSLWLIIKRGQGGSCWPAGFRQMLQILNRNLQIISSVLTRRIVYNDSTPCSPRPVKCQLIITDYSIVINMEATEKYKEQWLHYSQDKLQLWALSLGNQLSKTLKHNPGHLRTHKNAR